MRLDQLPLTHEHPTVPSECCQLTSKSGKSFVVNHYVHDGQFGKQGDWRFSWGLKGENRDRGDVTQDLLMAQCLLHDYLNK
jgi:hypothetical protein